VVKVYWKALLWNALILLASLMPTDGLSDSRWMEFPYLDKIVHFLMYAILTMLILRENHVFKGKYRQINVLTISFAYVFLMGFFIEILQNSFFIGRNFDIFDVLANVTGALVALAGFRIYHHLKQKKWISF
jgi:VanZ family protein